MVQLLWHLRGTVRLDGSVSNGTALDRVEELLKRQHKPVSERGPEHVAFNAPLWTTMFIGNWLAMVIYDRGRIWIEKDVRGRVLRYDLRSLHGFVFCLGAAGLFFTFDAVAGDVLEGLRTGSLAFAWLYGMNILLAVVRVPGLFRRGVVER